MTNFVPTHLISNTKLSSEFYNKLTIVYLMNEINSLLNNKLSFMHSNQFRANRTAHYFFSLSLSFSLSPFLSFCLPLPFPVSLCPRLFIFSPFLFHINTYMHTRTLSHTHTHTHTYTHTHICIYAHTHTHTHTHTYAHTHTHTYNALT